MVEGYRISSNSEEMDLGAIHAFISHSYWAKNINLDVQERAIKNSLCFGVFVNHVEQVGFARLITDKATYAYLADVYILEAHRGKGLSKWLMDEIMSHPDLQGLRRITLATSDAHGLYQKYRFTQLNNPDIFMEHWNPDVYNNGKDD